MCKQCIFCFFVCIVLWFLSFLFIHLLSSYFKFVHFIYSSIQLLGTALVWQHKKHAAHLQSVDCMLAIPIMSMFIHMNRRDKLLIMSYILFLK